MAAAELSSQLEIDGKLLNELTLLSNSENNEDRLAAIRSLKSLTPGNERVERIVRKSLTDGDSNVQFIAAQWSLKNDVNHSQARKIMSNEVRAANPHAMYFSWKLKGDRSFAVEAFESLCHHHDPAIQELAKTALLEIQQ